MMFLEHQTEHPINMDNKESKELNKTELPGSHERREACVYGPPLPQPVSHEGREACVYGPPRPRPSFGKKFWIAISIAIGAVIAFLLCLGFFGKAGNQSASTVYGPPIESDTTATSASESAKGVDTMKELSNDSNLR